MWGKEIDYDIVEELYKRKGYTFFKGEYNLNIFGIRSSSKSGVRFDDLLGCAYQHGGNNLFITAATLNPGVFYLQNLMDAGGAAIIKEGPYRGVFKLDWFRGTEALIQVRPFTVYRDKNLNQEVDIVPGSETTGLYGIFLHQHFQGVEEAKEIGKSSAGCVVPSTLSSYRGLMSLCKKQIPLWGNSFSFTVFTEKDLW